LDQNGIRILKVFNGYGIADNFFGMDGILSTGLSSDKNASVFRLTISQADI